MTTEEAEKVLESEQVIQWCLVHDSYRRKVTPKFCLRRTQDTSFCSFVPLYRHVSVERLKNDE